MWLFAFGFLFLTDVSPRCGQTWTNFWLTWSLCPKAHKTWLVLVKICPCSGFSFPTGSTFLKRFYRAVHSCIHPPVFMTYFFQLLNWLWFFNNYTLRLSCLCRSQQCKQFFCRSAHAAGLGARPTTGVVCSRCETIE